MTAPTPEKIERLEFYVEDDGDRDPWAVPHNDQEGDYVLYTDHLRHLKLAQIAVLEEMIEFHSVELRWAKDKIAALRKEIEE